MLAFFFPFYKILYYFSLELSSLLFFSLAYLSLGSGRLANLQLLSSNKPAVVQPKPPLSQAHNSDPKAGKSAVTSHL